MRLIITFLLIFILVHCSPKVTNSTSDIQQGCISELVTSLMYSDCDSLLEFLQENIKAISPRAGDAMSFEDPISIHRLLYWEIPGTLRSRRLSDTTIVKAFIRRECFIGLSTNEFLSVLLGDVELAKKYASVIQESEKIYGHNNLDLNFGQSLLGAGFKIENGVVVRVNYAHGLL